MTLEEYTTKYGEKEGTRRWKKSEANKHYYQSHRQEHREYYKRWYQEHREEMKQWYQEHREEMKQYYQTHHKERAEYQNQYNQTQYGRAYKLIRAYRRNDRLYNRGECTLTAQWVLENIFSRSCLYCGEEDWHLLGCDRINNSKPHTVENVICCCKRCNDKRHTKDFLDYAYSIGAKDSESLVIQY